jgi:WD40 repeat protein
MPFLATGGVDGVIHVIDTTTMKLRFSVNHDEAVTKLKWSPINPHLISSSVDGSLKVWDVRTGELVRTLKGHQNAILDFDIRPDGAVAVTGSDDGVSLVFPLV